MQTTHCPTCATTLKVTPDQLRLTNGWLRCDHCNDIFEAVLGPASPAEVNDRPSLEAVLAVSDMSLAVTEVTTAPLDLAPVTPPEGAVNEPSSVASMLAVSDVSLPASEPTTALLDHAPATPSPAEPLIQTPSLDEMLAALDAPLPASATTAVPLGHAPVSRSAPERRGIWLLACVCMLLLLLAQMAWVGRHVLFAQIPVLRPVLLAVCAPFKCAVTWPREPDALLIENSTFSEVSGGSYAVQLRLKNTAHYSVATPAMELSLLDLQDQVVVRRVVTQRELGLDNHLPAQREVRAQVYFNLEAAASQRVMGFRAFVFYP